MTGDQLRALRDKLNLTQQALADLLGVHKITVAHWESDPDKYPIPPIARLAIAHLNCKPKRRSA